MTTRVLLTGAAGAVGRATTQALLDRGARVVGLDRVAGEGIVAGDLRDADSVARAVAEAVDRLGGIDVLINNAGVAAPSAAGASPDDVARAMLEVNLLGTWRVTAAALPSLVTRHGRIVNVASGLSFANLPLAAAYCASKRAVAAYSDVLRLEVGDDVTVTTVYPGYMRTPLHDASVRAGFDLFGLLREESVDDAARTLVRAALGKPARDLATTRWGGVEIAVARHLPWLADRVILRRARAFAKRGRFDGAPLARELVARFSRA